jgi:hypothetical protein
MHLKKVRKQRPEAADIGPTPEAISKAEIATIAPSRHTSQTPVCRKEPMHNRLLERDQISAAAWEWVERYCIAYERVQGARGPKPETEKVEEDRAQPFFPREIQAATFLRVANERLREKFNADWKSRSEAMISACVMAHRVCDVAIVMGLQPKDTETMAVFTSRVVHKVYREVAKTIVCASGTDMAREKEKAA